ncbi:complexed with cef1p, partial [Teratosphaeriaceae sp. CCFEE 6253]
EDYETKKRRVLAETHDLDADSDSAPSSPASSEGSDSEEEEDETAVLLAELAKIKAERAEAAAKVAAEQAKKDEEQREKDIALGNPLLNGDQSGGDAYGVKRRWDDDVVFRNQARGTEDRGKEKRFVNDLLRSNFHRRFMDKYVR